nr:hypothetical protein [Actinomycetota bacterium]
GEDCFFLKLHLRSIDDLEEILDRFVVYGQTTTSIVTPRRSHYAPSLSTTRRVRSRSADERLNG